MVNLNKKNSDGRGANGKAMKGHPKWGGRKKGTPNKTTSDLRKAILLAAEECGFDGEGKEGTMGYLKRLALNEPKSFAGLLGKILPTTIANDEDSPFKFGGELCVKFVHSDTKK